MSRERGRRVFLIHLAVYAAVVALLAGLNLWFAPGNLWFIWVLLGWGIGVAAHGTALFLRTAHRRERIFIDLKARSFTVHAFAYVAVNLLLFIVNLTVTPKVWWFYWVTLGWGAGIIAHAWCAFFKRGRRPALQSPPAAPHEAESEPHRVRKRSPRT